MSPELPRATLDRATLLARLASEAGAAITVLTPNHRLASALQDEVDALQVAAGRAFWDAPDILSFSAYLERCHAEAVYSPGGEDVPALLPAPAAHELWEEAIRDSPWGSQLLLVSQTATMAARAWELAHQWRLEGAIRTQAGSEDIEAFADWAARYARRLERAGLTDAAGLAAVTASLVEKGRTTRPALLVAYAFDLPTPRQQDFLDACQRAGIEIRTCNPEVRDSAIHRTILDSPREEIEQAARWARARLESGGDGKTLRIGVVVPDLAKRRREVARVFSRVFAPGGERPGETREAAFNLSLGEALEAFPLVDAALAILELAHAPVSYDRASRLLRSPFVAGGESEMGVRARLDAALRRVAVPTLGLTRLRTRISQAVSQRGAPDCPQWLAMLDRVIEAARESDRAPPTEWARRFTRVLDAAGFPGERTLDSTEYQTLEKWREVLASLASLGLVSPPWDASQARSRLRRLCADTVFQPRSGQAPVQVLGVLESVGLRFDHLWVSGLTQDAWPLAANPDPFIATALQRSAGIPQASAERSLSLDREITRDWTAAAAEVVFSSARAEGDRELLASPLVAEIPAVAASQLGIPDFAQLRLALFNAGRAEGVFTSVADESGPPVAPGRTAGGTGILVDQAACPFRAFARYRLDARSLERPESGLGPPERGQLLHAMMASIWNGLRNSATLAATEPAALEQVIAEGAAQAVSQLRTQRPGRLEGHFAQLETDRLAGVARAWLAIEKTRSPFEVVQSEASIALRAGELELKGRVDRVDRLLGGGSAVIDYKSGQATVSAWLGERPDDAQLPLYALAAGDDVRAVAFARLKVGQLGFDGLARDDVALPGVAPVEAHRGAKKFVESWPALLALWRSEVDQLGNAFAAGDARVDPKRALATCERCDLRTLCRVHERLGALDEGHEAEDDEP